MNEARQQQLLASQTGLARKVYAVVPIQAAWSEHEILRQIRITGASVGPHTVRACLRDMKESGLIREYRGEFRREPVTLKPIKSEADVPKQQPPETKQTALSPLDQLSAISAELVIIGTEFTLRLKKLADRVDNAALSIELQRETDASEIARFHQLQTLLKGMQA